MPLAALVAIVASFTALRPARMMCLAQCLQVGLLMRSAIAQRYHVMHLGSRGHAPCLLTVLAQRAPAQDERAYPSPSRIVATSRRRRAARLRLPGMGGAVPPVARQGRAAGVTAWAGGGSRHRATPAHG